MPQQTSSQCTLELSVFEYAKSSFYLHCAKQFLLKPMDGIRTIVSFGETQSRVSLVQLLISEDSFALLRFHKDVRKVGIAEQLSRFTSLLVSKVSDDAGWHLVPGNV
jgi:hypothetical protein